MLYLPSFSIDAKIHVFECFLMVQNVQSSTHGCHSVGQVLQLCLDLHTGMTAKSHFYAYADAFIGQNAQSLSHGWHSVFTGKVMSQCRNCISPVRT